MNSSPETAVSLRILDPVDSDIREGSTLRLYPLESAPASGWIGLHGQTVVWLSLGPLDRAALDRYWKGPIKEGKKCPISARRLAAAARGNEQIELCPLGTPFQMKVWKRLLCIPFSTTTTYREIAAELGSPDSARAVGSAVGANPVAWLIPCHRVVPASGGIGAYRWGSDVKQKLIDWERADAPSGPVPEGREKLEAMLIKAQRFEDIGKLAGDIAHDLNNLLAPIGMATQLLKRKLSDDTLDRYVEIIETSTGRARAVIQEILSFSRETEGGEVETIAVRPLLEELDKMVSQTFPARIKASFSYPAVIPPLRMDPTQFHRAILNILVNARDAISGNGAIRVRTSVHDIELKVSVGERHLLPGRFVCISISDTGCGIPDGIRERIFDPFFTTKRKEEGTGLGLASVYGIVARAGGFIDLESTPGKGSTFHVYLPQAGE